jgi:HSP20 family molecular chaperone IbpA
MSQRSRADFSAFHLTGALQRRRVPRVCSMNSEPDKPRYWIPNTNVFISDTGDLIIKVALSGLDAGGVEITFKNNKLKMKGLYRDPEQTDSRQLLVNEIHVGPFENVLDLPDGFDLSAFRSTCLNGMLRIVVPREAGSAGTFEPPKRIKFD